MPSVIHSHDISCHFHADDSELQGLCASSELDDFSQKMSACTGWSVWNGLKLNEEKNKAVLLGKSPLSAGIGMDSKQG